MSTEPDLESAYALNTPEDNRAFYAAWAKRYDAAFVEATTYRFPRLVAETYADQGGGWPCLDVGCGTGAIGAEMPNDAVVDGLDLSPEMLEVAKDKGLYRNLIEANLKETLPIASGAYQGLVSAGTFTHGHVGPEAFEELVRILAPGALAVLTVKPEVWDSYAFAPAFAALVEADKIAAPEIIETPVYDDPSKAPVGHADDMGFIVTFRRL